MKVTVKTRFNASKQQIEQYSPGNYLVYLPIPEDPQAAAVIASLLSRQLGLPPHRIEFAGIDARKNWIFEAT